MADDAGVRVLDASPEVRISRVREVTPRDPVAYFLAGWRHHGRSFLWWQPSAGFALAGAGVADALLPRTSRPLGSVQAWWRALGPRWRVDAPDGAPPATGLVGWFAGAFDPADPRAAGDAYWSGWPAGAAALPRHLLTLRDGHAWLTANGAGVRQAAAGTAPGRAGETRPTRVRAVTDLPTAAAWAERVQDLEAALAAGTAEKVVLARCKRVVADAPVDPAPVLRRLARDSAESTVFAVGWGERCFLGATPERLVAVRGRQVQTGSLAGSRPRGHDPAEDERLGAELLASEKDAREHAYVVAAVRDALAPLCAAVRAEPVRLMRLRHVQHLFTGIAAEAHEPGALLALVDRLHPTPAVAGVPRAAALAAIRSLEARTRGWYAGPLGWVDAAGDGEAVVALRSAVLSGSRARLYAGCGIVAGSEAGGEFEEAETKFALLLAALGARP